MRKLLQWLFSLPPFLKERFASYTDPARVFSIYEFDRCITANTISLPESSRVAVVSGNYDEPELFFIGADRQNVDCLRFEEDPELWDLCKDWNSDDYHHGDHTKAESANRFDRITKYLNILALGCFTLATVLFLFFVILSATPFDSVMPHATCFRIIARSLSHLYL